MYIYIYRHTYIYVLKIELQQKDNLHPMCKKQGLSNAKFRCNVNSELCTGEPLRFFT